MKIRTLLFALAAVPAVAFGALHLTRDVEPDVRTGGQLSFEAKQAFAAAIRRDHPNLQPVVWSARAFRLDPEISLIFRHVHPDLGAGVERLRYHSPSLKGAFHGGTAELDGRADGCRTLTIRFQAHHGDVAERARICPRGDVLGHGRRWDIAGPVTKVPTREARAASRKLAQSSGSTIMRDRS